MLIYCPIKKNNSTHSYTYVCVREREGGALFWPGFLAVSLAPDFDSDPKVVSCRFVGTSPRQADSRVKMHAEGETIGVSVTIMCV